MSKVDIYTPPLKSDDMEYNEDGKVSFNIFLGGTIDNGESADWQQELISAVSGIELTRPVHIYNPRREDWPSSDNHREIDIQINWELDHLEKADLIVMNILADSKSPISLMEIGLFARTNKLIVFCPKTFYRYDNVRVVCQRFGIPLYNTNNIPYMTQKVCDIIGIDEELMKKKEMEEERKLIQKHREELEEIRKHLEKKDMMPDVPYGIMLRYVYREEKEFEQKYGEKP